MNACVVRFTVDNKVLLVKHNQRGWEFPGGKIDSSKDCFADTNIIDLLKTATREFHEEVSDRIGCVGVPNKVLYEPNYGTVFFVYCNQDCVFDCFDKYSKQLSKDEAIDEVRQFELSEIDNIKFSFDSDKQLIKTVLSSKGVLESTH